MTWQEYTNEVHKLVKVFGGALYQKKQIDDGWLLWKNKSLEKLQERVGISIFEGKPIDLKTEGMKLEPKKQVKYINVDDLNNEPINYNSLTELKKKHNASSLWDLVLKFKVENK